MHVINLMNLNNLIQRAAELRTRHRALVVSLLRECRLHGWIQARSCGAKTIDQNRLNIYQKSTKQWSKNQPKIDQKSTKINNKSTKIPPGLMGYPCFGRDQNRGTPSAQVVLDLGALLGSSWRRLETVLEASWAVLGGKSGQHGSNLASSWRPRRRQNPSWAVLEASWEPLGDLM